MIRRRAASSGQPAVAFVDESYGTVRYAERRAANGDVNCDGGIDFDDITPFVKALQGQDAYLAAYPNCRWLMADANNDGTVDFDDIGPFVAAFLDPGSAPPDDRCAADLSGDGTVDWSDFQPFINLLLGD